jgi:hypothetical protein
VSVRASAMSSAPTTALNGKCCDMKAPKFGKASG